MSDASFKGTRITRQFAQQRARATYEGLLEAAKQVFGESGFDNTQTPDIAQQASVSVGTFYRYFTDKRQIFLELVHLELEASYSEILGELDVQRFLHEDRRGIVEAALDALLQRVAENPALHREFLAMSLRDAEVHAIRQEIEDKGTELIASLIGGLVDRERIVDPAAAARVIVIAAQEVAMACAGLGSHKEPAADANIEAIRQALTDMVVRYVFGDQPVTIAR